MKNSILQSLHKVNSSKGSLVEGYSLIVNMKDKRLAVTNIWCYLLKEALSWKFDNN